MQKWVPLDGFFGEYTVSLFDLRNGLLLFDLFLGRLTWQICFFFDGGQRGPILEEESEYSRFAHFSGGFEESFS